MHCQIHQDFFSLSPLSISLEAKQTNNNKPQCLFKYTVKRILEAIDQCYGINTMSPPHLNFLDNKISLAQTVDILQG